MHQISKRVKTNIPTVVLTMLGIIQAFALELLWNYVSGTALLYSMTWQAFMSWTQVVIILVSIIAIWLVYACNVSRFVWVPSIQEFVLPFWVGLMQFMLIQLLDRAWMGLWLVLMAFLIATMIWIGQATMRKARNDPDNAAFFSSTSAATWRDFYPPIIVVTLLLFAGAYEWVTAAYNFFTLATLLLILGFLCVQIRLLAAWWNRSINLPEYDSADSASKSNNDDNSNTG